MSADVARFEWHEDSVIVTFNGFRFVVALIEAHAGGSHTVYLYGWSVDDSEYAIPGVVGKDGDGMETTMQLWGRDRSEAVSLVTAVLGVRGVVVTTPPRDPP